MAGCPWKLAVLLGDIQRHLVGEPKHLFGKIILGDDGFSFCFNVFFFFGKNVISNALGTFFLRRIVKCKISLVYPVWSLAKRKQTPRLVNFGTFKLSRKTRIFRT